MLKKAAPIILSVALSIGGSIALAGQSAIDQKKKVQPATSAQKVNKPSQSASKASTVKNSQAVNASKKINLTNERTIIQRKGPGHVA